MMSVEEKNLTLCVNWLNTIKRTQWLKPQELWFILSSLIMLQGFMQVELKVALRNFRYSTYYSSIFKDKINFPFLFRKSIAWVQEREDSGKNLKVCNNKNVNIYTVEKKDRNQKIGIKIDTKIFCLVIVYLQIQFFFRVLKNNLFVVDHTRVLLRDVDPSAAGADYINANHIRVSFNCCV